LLSRKHSFVFASVVQQVLNVFLKLIGSVTQIVDVDMEADTFRPALRSRHAAAIVNNANNAIMSALTARARFPDRKLAQHTMFQRKKRKADDDGGNTERASVFGRIDLRGGSHPLGVQPLGNRLMPGSAPSIRESGLGQFALASDQSLMALFEACSVEVALLMMQTSRYFYVLLSADELWRHWTLDIYGGDWRWQRSWQATFRARSRFSTAQTPLAAIRGIYSDDLFASWMAAASAFDARWLTGNNVPRRHVSALTVEQFRAEFEEPNRPVIIEGLVEQWSAFTLWTEQYLTEAYGQNTAHARGIDLPIGEFFKYAHTTRDDFPLYVFDKRFAHKAPQLARDYQVPAYFADDVLSLLPDGVRPDRQW
jgi:hypothetical protein